MLIAVFISSKEQCIKRQRQRQKKSGGKQIKKLFKCLILPHFSDEGENLAGMLGFFLCAKNVNKPSWLSSNEVLCLFLASFWILFFHYQNQLKRWKGKLLHFFPFLPWKLYHCSKKLFHVAPTIELLNNLYWATALRAATSITGGLLLVTF